MATPLPMVQRLLCLECANFQAAPTPKDDSVPNPSGGYQTVGKCRVSCPKPVLDTDRDEQWAVWPTVLSSDVCSLHTSHVGPGEPFSRFEDSRCIINITESLNRVDQTYKPESTITFINQSDVKKSAGYEYIGTRKLPSIKFSLGDPIVFSTCECCEYWKQDANNLAKGTCRQKAPEPIAGDESGTSLAVWLTTDKNDWCSKGKTNDAARRTLIRTGISGTVVPK